MVRESEIREGEVAVEAPPPADAALYFIGRIRTPWTSRLATPRQGRHDGPVCRLEIFEQGGHLFMLTHREQTLSSLRGFLDAPDQPKQKAA